MAYNGQSAPHQSESLDSMQTGKDAESLTSARSRALRALQGSLADIPVTSDDFAKMKQEVVEQEERVIARRS